MKFVCFCGPFKVAICQKLEKMWKYFSKTFNGIKYWIIKKFPKMRLENINFFVSALLNNFLSFCLSSIEEEKNPLKVPDNCPYETFWTHFFLIINKRPQSPIVSQLLLILSILFAFFCSDWNLNEIFFIYHKQATHRSDTDSHSYYFYFHYFMFIYIFHSAKAMEHKSLAQKS